MSSTSPERTSTEETQTLTGSGASAAGPERTTAFRPFGVPAEPSGWDDGDDRDEQTPARTRTRHVVDRFDGALALLVLRIVVAGIFAIRGLQKLQHLDVTRTQFTSLGVPYPETMAAVVGAAEVAIALALVLGLLVRVAGAGIATIAVGALVYARWRSGSFFTDGQPGFTGELELLLAAVGIAFLGLGGGGWGVDRKYRRR